MSEPHNCYCYVTAPFFNYIGLIVYDVYFFHFFFFLLQIIVCTFLWFFPLQFQTLCHSPKVSAMFIMLCNLLAAYIFHPFSWFFHKMCSIIIAVGNVQFFNTNKINRERKQNDNMKICKDGNIRVTMEIIFLWPQKLT